MITISHCKQSLTNSVKDLTSVDHKYIGQITSEIDKFNGKSDYGSFAEFIADFIPSSGRNFFTISSSDLFNSFEKEQPGLAFIFTPLNDHSREYMHRGDIVFCYRQGQFSSLDDALNQRGIYGLGVVLTDPAVLYPSRDKHNRYGVAIALPVILQNHLELRNIQLNPTTINLTPYNGNRNDSLQYIPNKNHCDALISMIAARNPDIQADLAHLVGGAIQAGVLPTDFWTTGCQPQPSSNNSNAMGIEDEFKSFLKNCCKSTRRSGDMGYTLGETACASIVAYLKPNYIFNFDGGEKWSYIKSMYEITNPGQVSDICSELLNNPDFITYDQTKSYWPSNAIIYYTLFIQARSLFAQSNTELNYICNQPAPPLKEPLQQIFYGAPGTGKSHKVDEMCKAYSNHRTTFHPDSDYSTFVGCYKPTKVKVDKKPLLNFNELADKLREYRNKDKNNETNAQVSFGYDYYQSLKEVDNLDKLLLASGGKEYDTYLSAGMLIAKKEEGMKKAGDITYSFTPQAFTNAYVEAWQKFEKNEPVLLVIEEINRGNCAQIFGDLFQLLDRNEDGYSTYPIEPDTDLGTYISEQGLNVQNAILKKKDGTTEDISKDINKGKKLVLPPNLYIWATMNTSDQSLFPIDSAFKRRWDWKYVPIRDKKEENYKIETDSYLFDWWDFLTKVNLAIGEATSSEDKKLGYFFCKGDKKGRISTDKFVSKVLFYLWTDVFKDYEADEMKFTHEGKDYELLQYKTKEGEKESIHKFSFSDFFTEDGDGDPSMVEKFLMNIEVLKEENIKEGKEVEDGGSDEEGATTGTFQADSKIPK